MAELCKNCDRFGCPTLTMPWLGGHSMGVTEAGATAVQITDRPAWWSQFLYANDPSATVQSAGAREFAKRECAAHAVDWRAEALRLRKAANFASAILLQHRGELGDVDGDFIQDAALAAGLLETVPMAASCGDNCRCEEYRDFPMDCIRYSALGYSILQGPMEVKR